MQHHPLVPAVLTLHVASFCNPKDTAPTAQIDTHEMSRLLLHRLMVLEVALQRVAELYRKAAQAPLQ